MNRERLSAFPYWPQLVIVIIIILVYEGYRYFSFYNTRSNDAYVSAHVVNMAPLVTGPISKIYVQENQAVKKDDKLLEIDPRPYFYAMQQAKAEYEIAKRNYENNQFLISMAEENLKSNESLLSLSQKHYTRYQALSEKGGIHELRLIDFEAKLAEEAQNVTASKQKLKIAIQNVDKSPMLSALAAYQQAQYNYEHTTLKAPADGLITNFNIRQGQYVQAGKGLFALIETEHWWVITRYRETMIRLIKPGDKATITLDMYPDKTFHGHVESISWGINRMQSGNVAPSTLVYLEPSENWIKIAQRFPVRITIDDVSPDYPLRIGASAVTTTSPP